MLRNVAASGFRRNGVGSCYNPIVNEKLRNPTPGLNSTVEVH